MPWQFPTGDCRAADWPALGRDHTHNAVSSESDPPTDWDVKTGRNIKWKAEIASTAFGTQVVADGLVWIGGNLWRPGENEQKDAALLLCFNEQTGEKLYEYVSLRLQSASYQTDPPWHGLGSSPLIEGDRLWFVTNRCETVCLDIAPLKQQPRGEPQVLWKVDLRDKFGVHPSQPFMGPSRLCSIPPSYQGLIFVNTCNGVDQSYVNVPAPEAPGLICFDKQTGEAKWTVPTGPNVLYSEVASPLVAEIGGRGQVVMPHGDGWVRSYDPQSGRLLWEFDGNAKEGLHSVRGRSTRNYFTSTPVLHEGRIYIGNGDQPEHGEGDGRLVCIEPTKSGDVSSELAVDKEGNALPPRRLQNVDTKAGEQAILNPDSGLVWEYVQRDVNDNGKFEYEETMHRTVASVAIDKGLLVVPDFSGIIHCVDPQTGRTYWTYDSYTQVWASPLIVGDTVYVGTEDGMMLLFRLSADPARALSNANGVAAPIAEIDMEKPIYAAPIFANGVLYVTTRTTLYAIHQQPTE
jgi:outer membrane protein assembly factor BamB